MDKKEISVAKSETVTTLTRYNGRSISN